MKVSVIVPSYNHRPFVGQLIDSIQAQTFKDFELIVLDDGSTDGSAEFLREQAQKFGFQLVVKPNEGLCRTLNRGLEMAKGEYVVIFASDDVMPPNRLKEQVEFLDSNPSVQVVAGGVMLIDEQGLEKGFKAPGRLGEVTLPDMVSKNRVMAPTAMIRKNVFDHHGHYPVDFVMEDYYLWLKILRAGGKIHVEPHVRAHYRIDNRDLERKYYWYYRGSTQVLSQYAEEASYRRQLSRNRLIFAIKMALLLGSPAISKYKNDWKEMNLFDKFVVWSASVTPAWIRDLVLRKLQIKV